MSGHDWLVIGWLVICVLDVIGYVYYLRTTLGATTEEES